MSLDVHTYYQTLLGGTQTTSTISQNSSLTGLSKLLSESDEGDISFDGALLQMIRKATPAYDKLKELADADKASENSSDMLSGEQTDTEASGVKKTENADAKSASKALLEAYQRLNASCSGLSLQEQLLSSIAGSSATSEDTLKNSASQIAQSILRAADES